MKRQSLYRSVKKESEINRFDIVYARIMATYSLKGTDRVLVNIKDSDAAEEVYVTHQLDIDKLAEQVLSSAPSIGSTLKYVQNDGLSSGDNALSASLAEGTFTSNLIGGGFTYDQVDTFIFAASADMIYLQVGEEIVFRNITLGHSAIYKVSAKTNNIVTVTFASRSEAYDSSSSPLGEILDSDSCTIEIRREVYPLNMIQGTSDVSIMETVNLDLKGLTTLP